MRRYGVNEGSGDEVFAELQQSQDDRITQGEREKAAEYGRAKTAVEAGGEGTEVAGSAHQVHRVVSEPRQPRRYLTVEDSREHILAELRGHVAFHGERGDEFARAVAAVEAGAIAVFVDGVQYRVIAEGRG